MVNLLKKIYHKLSRFTVIKNIGTLYLNGLPLGNYLAYRRLKKNKFSESYNNNNKIKVAFIGQNIQVWEKISSVFDAMRQSGQFDVVLYALSDITDKERNTAYEYFRGIYNNVIAVNSEGKEYDSTDKSILKDIKSFSPDYVFYTRPYDQYLPKAYRSNVVSKYSKVCYCTYTFILTYNILHDCYSKVFARNVYIYFAENKFMRNHNRKRFDKAHKTGVMKSVFLGYPIMNKIALYKKISNDNRFSIMWTPRWSTSLEVGGSSFFDYKDKIVDYTKDNPGVRLLFRPHPLAFHHFIQTGEMSQSEVDEYVGIYDGDKFIYDKSAEYGQTFADADVLVSDISSMIPEYYITKKPIIYCNTGADLLPVMEKMLCGCYISNSWKETEKYIEMLKNGEDPLKDKRSEICDKIYGSDLSNIADRFINYIIKDYRGDKI